MSNSTFDAENKVIEFHKEIYQILMEYRRHNPITFYVRKNNDKNGRLKAGYYFQGNEKYLSLGLYKVGDSKNKTQTICYDYTFDASGKNQLIQVVYAGIKDLSDQEKMFYEELIKVLDKKLDQEKIKDTLYYFWFPSNDYKANIKLLIEEIKPLIDSLLIKYSLEEKYIITEEEFMSTKHKTDDVRTKGNGNGNGKKLELENRPLNQILYGPPGTGKTYNTINKAIELIENRIVNDEEDRIELKKSFEKYQNNGQIEFITFHQSYGYEEFVEGIKADLDSGEIKYKLEEGIFKKLSVEALFEDLIFEDFEKDLNYYELYDILITKFKKEKNLLMKSKDNKNIELREISNKDNLYCYHYDSNVKHTVGKERLKKLYDQYNLLEELNKLSGFHEIFTKIIGGANQTIYWTILNQLLIYKEEMKKEEKDEDIDYETKKELIRNNPKINFKNDSKKYILIIDEINRGNISKIFGELITLIEPSKRIGKNEEIMLKLPNSQDSFGVPSNLYIIGTMNTADRSITQIDTALRRRFVFEEMMPKPELLVDNVNDPIIIKDTGIEVQKILEAINERIEYLYDREHTIGHSYFMDLLQDDCNTKAKLDEIFRVNIIPLLAEYFYGDWNDIKIILNDNNDYFITEKKIPTYIIAEPRNNNKIYTVNQDILDKEGFSEEGYKNIYKEPKAV